MSTSPRRDPNPFPRTQMRGPHSLYMAYIAEKIHLKYILFRKGDIIVLHEKTKNKKIEDLKWIYNDIQLTFIAN